MLNKCSASFAVMDIVSLWPYRRHTFRSRPGEYLLSQGYLEAWPLDGPVCVVSLLENRPPPPPQVVFISAVEDERKDIQLYRNSSYENLTIELCNTKTVLICSLLGEGLHLI